MGAIPQVRKTGPKSYPAAEAVVGGQLVEGRAASKVGVAAAGSVKVLGVSLNDAVAVLVTDPVGGVLNTAPLGTRVNVAKGVEVPVKYAAAAALGDKLIAASNGRVTPAGANPDARTIVGECTEPAGVTVVDSVAKAWIY
ncbi:hypothetical protein [Nocardioides lianchengensis]|uniref:Uncharacterized protein n=1 Tax=Nocardioides lianchengensis TaxID=1045774 RepID=A0A1G6LRL4_9ACTN|nr:hypothetical protein [Nocardioides lianchengensis]NYG12465.1 hypothetical protein [Nocardioides lianchengensis]SDC45912.1 hypothetical protein SAMN05421872_102339 [Nocardioides lianchengensis]